MAATTKSTAPASTITDPLRAGIQAAALITSLIAAACSLGDTYNPSAPILLFNGTGTSPNDVAAVESVLSANHLDYTTANSRRLNRMTSSEIRVHRLIIIPGGNFIHIGKGLTPAATATLRSAVENGVNYLGICAGAFLAGKITGYNSLNLTRGVQFGFYAAENQGFQKAAVPITIAGAPTLEHYWENGPELTGWGSVVGKYPDGTAAIVQGTAGNGWVVLAGVHPEAPEYWRRGMVFNTPAPADNAYAASLVRAALNRELLPHY